MNDHSAEPKALFISPDGNIYPDTLICSGILPAELGGKPCPFSQAGRIPDPVRLNADAPNYTVDKGQPGDLCPPCAKQQLANLGHWQDTARGSFPKSCCRCGCSNVASGFGWSCRGCATASRHASRPTARVCQRNSHQPSLTRTLRSGISAGQTGRRSHAPPHA